MPEAKTCNRGAMGPSLDTTIRPVWLKRKQQQKSLYKHKDIAVVLDHTLFRTTALHSGKTVDVQRLELVVGEPAPL